MSWSLLSGCCVFCGCSSYHPGTGPWSGSSRHTQAEQLFCYTVLLYSFLYKQFDILFFNALFLYDIFTVLFILYFYTNFLYEIQHLRLIFYPKCSIFYDCTYLQYLKNVLVNDIFYIVIIFYTFFILIFSMNILHFILIFCTKFSKFYWFLFTFRKIYSTTITDTHTDHIRQDKMAAMSMEHVVSCLAPLGYGRQEVEQAYGLIKINRWTHVRVWNRSLVSCLAPLDFGREAGEQAYGLIEINRWTHLTLIYVAVGLFDTHCFEWPYLLKFLCTKVVKQLVFIVQSIVFQHMFFSLWNINTFISFKYIFLFWNWVFYMHSWGHVNEVKWGGESAHPH